MAITVYRWDDTSAPSLTHGAGGIITVLDAVLVNGYGSKAALGWSKPFGTASNVTVYKQPVGTNQRYLRVDAATVGTYHAEARVSSYETMTDMNTGTGKVPTTYQNSNGFLKWVVTENSSAVSPYRWIVIGDTSWFYLITEIYTNNASNDPFGRSYGEATFHFYGDLLDVHGSDAYATCISSYTGYNTSTTSSYWYNNFIDNNITTSSGNQYSLFAHRPISQTGSGALLYRRGFHQLGSDGYGQEEYPNSRGELVSTPVMAYDFYQDGTSLPVERRGVLPSLRYPCHSSYDMYTAGIASLDTVSDGVDDYLIIWYADDYSPSWFPVLFQIT